MAYPDGHVHLATPHGQFGAALSEAEVRRLQSILERDCGVSVTLPEAWSRATALLSLVEVLLQNGGAMPAGGESSTGVRASSLLTDCPS
jgi:hypothetical protein